MTQEANCSVIICTKDRPTELTNCMNSIKSQTCLPKEILIIDDGSLKKETLNIIYKTNIKSKIVYIKKSEPGLTKSRNIGIRKAIGKIIIFIDDDVLIERDFIKNLIVIFEKDKYKKIGGITGQDLEKKF